MNKKRKSHILLELGVIAISFAALLLLLYFVVAVSFQNGTVSSDITQRRMIDHGIDVYTAAMVFFCIGDTCDFS